jgi:hypothetical protein
MPFDISSSYLVAKLSILGQDTPWVPAGLKPAFFCARPSLVSTPPVRELDVMAMSVFVGMSALKFSFPSVFFVVAPEDCEYANGPDIM